MTASSPGTSTRDTAENVRLAGLNLVGVGGFEGKSWSGNKLTMGLFMDERADNAQREALDMIFGGRAGGWPAQLAAAIGEIRGVEFVPIDVAIDDDLASWRVEIPGKIDARAEALTGPTTLPGRRVQMVNSPGCETGPEGVVTWGESVYDRADAFGFSFEYQGRSSRIITFDWSGPDS